MGKTDKFDATMDELDCEEYFSFSYRMGDRDAEVSMTYPDGTWLYDTEGPLKLFQQFMQAAGYESKVGFTVNGKPVEDGPHTNDDGLKDEEVA